MATKTKDDIEQPVTDSFEEIHRAELIPALYDERRGYEQRVAIAEAEGNPAAVKHMQKHIEWVNEELTRFGEDVSDYGKPTRSRAKAADESE